MLRNNVKSSSSHNINNGSNNRSADYTNNETSFGSSYNQQKVNTGFTSQLQQSNVINNTTTQFGTDAILAQALPGPLAAPKGWRSEVIDSSINVNTIENQTNFIENFDEYKTLNAPDAPPIIFSSINEQKLINNDFSSFNLPPTTTIDNTAVIEDSKIDEFYEKHKSTVIHDNTNEYDKTPPVILHKTLPNNTVTYRQNISVKYLQPPTPPPPGPIIIREVRPPPPPPQSPIQIRQRAPPPPTPPPIIIREKPPPPPSRSPPRVVEKVLPPPPAGPRRMIVEHYAPCPPKPADVIIERWLPYKRSDRRRILYERAPTTYIPRKEPNLLILHQQPHARVHREIINQGVTRADPHYYLQRYGAEIYSSSADPRYSQLLNEVSHEVPPPHSLLSTNNFYRYQSSPYPHTSNVWDRTRSVSPVFHSTSHHQSYSGHTSPYHLSTQHPYGSHLSSYDSYNDYLRHKGDVRTLVDMTPFWNRDYHSSHSHLSIPSYEFPSTASSYYPSNTIRVSSDDEFRHVLTNLTNGRLPTPLRSY